MKNNTWNFGNLKITYSNPIITPFSDYKNGEYVDRTVKSIKDAMYFYYNVNIFDGEKKIFSTGTHDNPKVQELPFMIEAIIEMNMKERGYVYNEVKGGGFHRKIEYAQITLKDPFGDSEYSYKFEKYHYKLKQSEDSIYKLWTDYTLTISEMGNTNTYGNAVVIKHIKHKDLLRLKDVAEDFCKYAVTKYNAELEDE